MNPLTPDELRAAGYLAAQTFDRERRELENYLLLARAVFDAAVAVAETHPEEAGAYRSIAMNTSYNIAAACWPGWEDAHREITDDHLALALEMCRYHVATGRELDTPPVRRFNGYWIQGAVLMAAGEHDEARGSLEAAANCADAADAPENRHMAHGWIIANDILRRGGSAPNAELESIIGKLRALGDDGEFYAAQFAPALRKLAARSG